MGPVSELSPHVLLLLSWGSYGPCSSGEVHMNPGTGMILRGGSIQASAKRQWISLLAT